MTLTNADLETVVQTAESTTVTYLRKIAVWFGMTNAVFLLAAFVYVFFFLPTQAARQAETRLDEVIAGSTCQDNEFLAGVTSIHSNSREDRAFDFVCCRVSLLGL